MGQVIESFIDKSKWMEISVANSQIDELRKEIEDLKKEIENPTPMLTNKLQPSYEKLIKYFSDVEDNMSKFMDMVERKNLHLTKKLYNDIENNLIEYLIVKYHKKMKEFIQNNSKNISVEDQHLQYLNSVIEKYNINVEEIETKNLAKAIILFQKEIHPNRKNYTYIHKSQLFDENIHKLEKESIQVVFPGILSIEGPTIQRAKVKIKI